MVGLFSKIKLALIDYYHLLFKSAAINHLRIQEILKNPDGTYQLTVKFNSYSELKNYQRKLRRFTVSLSSAVAMVIVAFIAAPYILNPNKSSASNFTWIQDSWGIKDQTKVAKYPDDNGSTITNFYDSNGVSIDGNGDLTLVMPQISNLNYPDHSDYVDNSIENGFYLSNAGAGAKLTLKKPQGASCASSSECVTGITCVAGKCCNDACCGVTSVTDTRDTNNPIYNTVLIGNQCWLARNLNVGTKLASYSTVPTDPYSSSAVQKWCYNNLDSNCNTYGGLYTWAEANGLGNSCNTGSCSLGTNNQGICPSGWHIPTDSEFYTLENYLKDSGATCSSTRLDSFSCASAGAKLKSTGSSGFKWLFGGYNVGGYANIDSVGDLMSATVSVNTYFVARSVSSANVGINRFTTIKSGGHNVRCIKN